MTEWQWWFSQDRESWQGPFKTKDEAVGEGRGLYTNESFYICEAAVEDYRQMDVSPEEVLEQVSDRYIEFAGDDSLFNDVSNQEMHALGSMLTEVLHQWIKQYEIKTGIISFSATQNEEEIPET